MSDQCSSFLDPSVVGFLFASSLAVGISFSYVPQHIKIIHRRTSEGISPLFLLLGTTSGISAFSNLILLSHFSIDCCYSFPLTVFECLSSQLGMIQVGAQAICATLILVFCIYCTKNSPTQDKIEYEKLYHIWKFIIVYSIVHVCLILFIFLINLHLLIPLANLLGVTATILASFQYFPQIYTTFKLKHTGSLSVPMMCMQTPGGFVWTLSLILRPGAIWSSWLPYLTAATLQGILLLMCIFYQYKYPTLKSDQNLLIIPDDSNS
ncbi:PQ-loop repeat-containing protein ASCRUDRAFT_78974 [Ascoidea rubescens DSM 1968]|uniref:PQ-loop-domain-containing protein n=1 Tax=Ascoidea rubescens DSM 1968 TaxID=1344418 RepID=A0A1D2VQZ6_9ASCO|nr:hypothetical protein ASCRUDRAFT_78974 [Ascoidea rubescens DSM 1968]ODV64020.1 hypothetical protein ASCRUDRAFT_78974 [Ascoidea rubescens DSM 1968]